MEIAQNTPSGGPDYVYLFILGMCAHQGRGLNIPPENTDIFTT